MRKLLVNTILRGVTDRVNSDNKVEFARGWVRSGTGFSRLFVYNELPDLVQIHVESALVVEVGAEVLSQPFSIPFNDISISRCQAVSG
jgi:hypothetical protein